MTPTLSTSFRFWRCGYGGDHRFKQSPKFLRSTAFKGGGVQLTEYADVSARFSASKKKISVPAKMVLNARSGVKIDIPIFAEHRPPGIVARYWAGPAWFKSLVSGRKRQKH
jgi:hypothetical protein